MTNYEIAVIGGDLRQAYMAEFLEERGRKVIGYLAAPPQENKAAPISYQTADSLWQAVASADVIVGGIPLIPCRKQEESKKSGYFDQEELLQCVREGQMLFAGMIPEKLIEQLSQKGVECHDFMKYEEIAVFNAIATAEGAIMEAMAHSATNIHNSKCLVLGYGRCGTVLADKLKGLSAKVTVCCRNAKELAYADALGMNALSLRQLDSKIKEFAYLFNTIPVPVLDGELLKSVAADAVIIDLASGEGGVDAGEAKRLSLCACHCLGIPGKYAPKTSALRLTDFVEEKAARLLLHGMEKI